MFMLSAAFNVRSLAILAKTVKAISLVVNVLKIMKRNKRYGCAVGVEHISGDPDKCVAYNKEVEYLKTKIQY